ncbi:hypothetical protein ABPG74_010085 [Tetrahymena malaccensis]
MKQNDENLLRLNIQILQNNVNQMSFEEYAKSLQNQEDYKDLKYMENVLLERKYKPIRFAGKGSFGKIIIAEDEYQNKFAFKFILIMSKYGQVNQDLKYKALREAYIMRTLNHPNIVKFYGYFETSHFFIIKMEECKGDLQQLINCNHRPLSVESLIKYGHEISSGLQYIHDQGLIQRDLKPDNILIDLMNVAKISDFGLSAHAENGRIDQSIQGAQCFRAPELQSEFCSDFIQKLEKENPNLILQSTKSDCFSLGLVFYSCLGLQSFENINLIENGPDKINVPIKIQNNTEYQCIEQLLKRLCQQHPNDRMEISDIIKEFENLKKTHLPQLFEQQSDIFKQENLNQSDQKLVRLQLKAKDEEISRLQNQLMELIESKEKSELNNYLLNAKVKELRQEIDQKIQMISQLTSEIFNLCSIIKQQNTNNFEKENQLKAIQEILKNQEQKKVQECEELRYKIYTQNVQISSLQLQLDEQTSKNKNDLFNYTKKDQNGIRIEELLEQRDDALLTINQMIQIQENQESQIKQLNKDLSKKQQQLLLTCSQEAEKKLQQRIKQLSEQNKLFQQSNNEKGEKINNLLKSIENFERIVHSKDEEIINLKTNLTETSSMKQSIFDTDHQSNEFMQQDSKSMNQIIQICKNCKYYEDKLSSYEDTNIQLLLQIEEIQTIKIQNENYIQNIIQLNKTIKNQTDIINQWKYQQKC